jgi:Rrf2 family iron-sulfur cluster assembly transcriptional regulator
MTTELAVGRWNASMQLTRAADYGVRVMLHLASVENGERVSLADLVAATGTPDSFLSKVLQGLARAGLVTSRRGPSGGFEISMRGRHASMREVIEAIDGRMCLNVCLSERRSCARKDWCPAHKVWVKAQAAMLEVLGTAMIGELVGDPDRTGADSGGH